MVTASVATEKNEKTGPSIFCYTADHLSAFNNDWEASEHFTVSLEDGEVLLVNFASTSCPMCRAELPHLQEVWDTKNANRNFRAVVILPHEEAIESVRSTTKFVRPIACDVERTVFDALGVTSVPRTFVISSEGILCAEVGYREATILSVKRAIQSKLGSG